MITTFEEAEKRFVKSVEEQCEDYYRGGVEGTGSSGGLRPVNLGEPGGTKVDPEKAP